MVRGLREEVDEMKKVKSQHEQALKYLFEQVSFLREQQQQS